MATREHFDVSTSGQASNPLSRKLNKLLETRLDNDKEMLEALKALSMFFTENNLRTRRNLRSDIERSSLAINEDFIGAFQAVKEMDFETASKNAVRSVFPRAEWKGCFFHFTQCVWRRAQQHHLQVEYNQNEEITSFVRRCSVLPLVPVDQKLDFVYDDVKGMNECCQDMTNRLKAAKAQTHDLLSQTTKLQAESQKLQMKEQVADAFLSKFQLKPEEVKILRGAKMGNLHEHFFEALARVKQIHSDCKVLLRTNQQTAGLEIMESMALHQESAYERLYRWTQNECRALTSDSPDIPPLLCQAMEALKDRPVLFRYSLDEFGTARRTAVVRGLIDALTRGGAGGTPRPIELHSHDPLRYVGDMLAWLHQATASEKEHLQTLLKKCPDDQIEDILSHITEGVCRPFKVRVEQVLVSESDAVVLYKLNNLLKFYLHTIGQIISQEAALLATTEEMQVLSHKMFFNSLNCHATKLLEKIELPPHDLGHPASLTQTLQLLRDVLACHDASVVPIDDKKQDFKQILSCMVDPLLQMCSVSASRLNTLDMAAYMVNCIYLMETSLALYEYTDSRLEMLQAQVDAHVDTLISEQASFVLNRVNLAVIYGTIQQHQPKQGPLSAFQGLDSASVKSAMSNFDSFLASPDTLILPQCNLILSSSVRESVKKNSVKLLCEAYKQMYDAICKPANNYKEPQSIVPRTPDQVIKLLS